MVNVKLYWKDKIIDLTNYVDWRSIIISETADETLNTAKLKLPSVKGLLQELDFSRPLPRFALVEIELEGTKQFVIATDNVEEVDEGLFKHEIECVSVAKLLLDTTNAGLTITQPGGEIPYYFRSYSFYSGYFNSDTKTEVNLLTTENSTDTSEIDGRTLKKNKEYIINFKGVFYTNGIILSANSWYFNKFELTIEIGGQIVKQEDIVIDRRNSFLDLFGVGDVKRKSVSFSINYTNTGTKEVKAYLRMLDTGHGVGSMEVEDFKIAISTTSESKDETIYLDYVVEKLLKNDMNEQRFYLDGTSKGYLSTIRSHEYTLPESYLWLQLQRIAEHIKAFLTARMGNIILSKLLLLGFSFNGNYYTYDYSGVVTNLLLAPIEAIKIMRNNPVENGDVIRISYTLSGVTTYYFYQVSKKTIKAIIVSMTPYEELLIEAIPEGIDLEYKSATIDDYAAKLEINADNVYSEQTTIKEITSLRAEGELAQITTENIIIPTKYGIGEIVGFRVKTPREIKLVSDTITIAKGTWVNIEPSRILRKEHYDTLVSEAWYNLGGRRSFMKNNTLYFNMGKPNISGLSYIGGQDKTMLEQNKYIRAIYEIMLATLCDAYDDNGTYDNWDDGKVVTDNEIIVEVEYRPHKRTSANIFKSDQSGFEFTTSKFLNDIANLNSPDIIASYTQAMADRSGGTIIDYTGIVDVGKSVNILTTWEKMPLFSKTIRKVSDDKIGFSYQYIKDFVFHNSYEGYNKKERLEEIPRESVVSRVNKKNTLVVFDLIEKSSDSELPVAAHYFVNHLVSAYVDNSPKLALLSHKKESEVKSLLPVSTEAYGRTIEFLIEMKDNYSSGLFKYPVGVGDSMQVYQQDYRYTNEFGRVEDVEINIFSLTQTPTLTDSQIKELPKVPSGVSGSSAFYKTTYNERKDARERSIYSLQVSFLSANDDIIIYDAIAKFSNMLSKKLNGDIVCGKFSVMPSRTATTIDTIIDKKLNDVAVSITANKSIDFSSGGVYVFYDRNDRELLLAVNFKQAGANKLYFRGENQ